MFVPLFSTRSCTNKWVTVQYWCIDAEPQGESQGVYSQPRQGAGHLCLENKHSRCYTRDVTRESARKSASPRAGQRAAQTTSWTLLRLCLQLDGARVWPMRTSCTPSSSAGALRQTVSTQSVAAPKNACRQLKRDAGRHRRCWGC